MDPTAFTSLLERVHTLGRTVIASAASSVDAEARFPTEAFTALKEEKLLSCYVSPEWGGMGMTMPQLSRLCEILGLYCGSTAMIFAMHQIQVGCIQHHASGSPYFQGVLKELVLRQLLLASATTELGIGGDVRTSSCAVIADGSTFSLEKMAQVISYALDSDAILVTARKNPEAGPHDQVHVFVRKENCSLEPLSTWDTLGFRGTCSLGFKLKAQGDTEQILPAPYSEIHAKTMHAFSHGVWSSLWLGIATDAVQKARGFVRAEARKTPGTLPPGALRLAEVDSVLFTMRNGVENIVAEYEERLKAYPNQPFPTDFGFAIRVNNLKVTSSMLLIEVVSKAMIICGISGYRNDSRFSLCRHLRDAYGASLMVNNDRILGQSSTMQIVQREG
jgi:acyl-CoA dehydrogenase